MALLLDRGAAVDLQQIVSDNWNQIFTSMVALIMLLCETGASPLCIACQNGHTVTAALLLDRGAAVDLQDKVSDN